MTRGRFAALALVALLLGFVGRWYFASPPSDEDQIRALITSVADAAGKADIDGCIEPVSADYHTDEFGGLDRRDVSGFLYLQFRRYGPVKVVLGPLEIARDGDTATATFDAVLMGWGPSGGGILPDNADAWHMVVGLRREDDGWRVVTHRRESQSGR